MISLSSSKASGQLTDPGSMRLRFIRGFCSPSLELCFKREIIRTGDQAQQTKDASECSGKTEKDPWQRAAGCDRMCARQEGMG